ncbi:UNVERIFIED_CONTAM: hypothetical protein GTU68_029944, partial [Idotea baltica]|nr:hypothetical protein [Idotea baltica]
TGSVTSGNKIRKLEFTLARAKEQGANVIITCGGVQSNHCRATAILGAQLGFKVHLILRGEEPNDLDGNLFLDHLSGAEISYFSPKYYNARLDFIVQEVSDEYRKEGLSPYFITTGASDATGVWGYFQAAEEIALQEKELGFSFDKIVCATGSGGTQAGLTAGALSSELKADVIGIAVCDNEEYFLEKVRQDILEWKTMYKLDFDLRGLNINVNDNYVGPGYAKAQPEVFRLIKKVMQSEGIGLDPVYTGKAFYGLLEELREGRLDGENILFIHTGGLFGLFAQREQYFEST